MRYRLDSLLPEKAFQPRGGRRVAFASGGMTLEGGDWSPEPWSQDVIDAVMGNQGGGDQQSSVTVEGAPPEFNGISAVQNGPQGGDNNLNYTPQVFDTNRGGAVDQAGLDQLYQQYFGRPADASGSATWGGQDYGTVLQGILGSQEYASRNPITPTGDTNFNLNDYYQQYFGRNVDPSGAITWANKSPDEIKAGLLGSSEYTSLHPNGALPNQSNAPIASSPLSFNYNKDDPIETQVYQHYIAALGRAPDKAGFDANVAAMRAGASSADVFQSIIDSSEGKRAQESGLANKYGTQTFDENGNPIFKTTTNANDLDLKTNVVKVTPQYSTNPETGAQVTEGQTYYYKDGSAVTVDNSGTVTGYQPPYSTYTDPSLYHKGYKDLTYSGSSLSGGGYNNNTNMGGQTVYTNFQGKLVPVAAAEYLVDPNKHGVLLDKNGDPMLVPKEVSSGWSDKILDYAPMIMAAIATAATAGGASELLVEAAGTMAAEGMAESEIAAMLESVYGATPFEAAQTAASTMGTSTLGTASSIANAGTSVVPEAAISTIPEAAITATPELAFSPAEINAINEGTQLANEAVGTGTLGAGDAALPTVAPSAAAAPINPVTGVPWEATGSGLTSNAAAASPWYATGNPYLDSIIANAGKGSLINGIMGGINAEMGGQNIFKGAGIGALTGAVGAGGATAFGGGLLGNVLGGAAAGATGSSLTGQDITRGLMYGGAGGALNYGLANSDFSKSLPDWANNPVTRGLITGTAYAGATGGNLMRGAVSGAGGAYAGNAINNALNTYFNNPSVQPQGGLPNTRAEVNTNDVRTADNNVPNVAQPQAVSPLAQLTSDNQPLPNIYNEDNYVKPFDAMRAGDVQMSNVDSKSYFIKNEDGTLTAVTPEGTMQVPAGSENQILAQASNVTPIDWTKGDQYVADVGSRAADIQNSTRPIPLATTSDPYGQGNFSGGDTPINARGFGANEPYMQDVASLSKESTAGKGNYGVDIYSVDPIEAGKTITSGTNFVPQTPEEIQTGYDRTEARNLSQAGPMSQPTDPQEALAISESPQVQANATPQQEEIINQLKDIITSDVTTPEQKEEAAKELKQLSIAIATEGSDTGVDKGALSGVDGGDLNGARNGVLGSNGIQPGTAGGLWGDEGNPGLDKPNEAPYPDEPPDEEPPDEEPPEEDLTPDEPIVEPPPDEPPPEEPEKPTKPTPVKPPLKPPLPIKKPVVYPSQIPGYSWNENITGALPHNLTATMLAGASTQEGRRMSQQLKQLYPQLANIDPHLLQTLTGRVGGGGGGALSTPAPGYPSQASGNQTANFAQSNMPASFSALGSAGLQALGGASNPNVAGYASGGDVHVPEFKTGTTGHYVQGRGDGQSDEIPAMLANGEYVFDADTVAALGNGSNEAGAIALDKMREAIRKHKRSAPHTKIPPKAKSPLEYLKGK